MDEQVSGQKNSKNLTTALVIISLIIIASLSVVGYQAATKDSAQIAVQPTPTTVVDQTEQTSPTSENEGEYEDGTYSVTGTYTSPGGAEELGVTVTLKDGVITAAEVKPKATRPISKMKQNDFAAHFKPMVVGKRIDEVQLSKVSGSSLSPKGFNDALEKIKAEAEV